MIEVSNFSFEYQLLGRNSLKVLENINLHIRAGERVAIVGPSGAGKSTFLKCINQLLRTLKGSIKINGQEVIGRSENSMQRIRQKIGMIFQNFNLIQRALVIDNVLAGRLGLVPPHRKYLYGFSYSPEDYEIALASLQQVQIKELAFRRVDRLSGGQQQRVGIARALTQNPTIILADEPVSNLDPKIKTEIMNLLITVCKEKKLTLLISIHEIELITKHVSRILGLSNGQFVFDGKPQELNKDEYDKIYG